jgi:hypothetical protein
MVHLIWVEWDINLIESGSKKIPSVKRRDFFMSMVSHSFSPDKLQAEKWPNWLNFAASIF